MGFGNPATTTHAMRTTTLLLTLLLASGAFAQRDRDRFWGRDRPATLGGGLEIGIPVGAFADSWGREIVGVSADLGVPMRLLPFDWGFDFAWGSMGGESRLVEVEQENLDPNTTGNLTVRSNVYGYHGTLRFKPVIGKVSPYIEGLAGLRHFTTRTRIKVDGTNEQLSKERNASAFTGSAGWAVGVQVAPTRGFYVEGRLERLNGGKVTYVDPRSISITSGGDVSYETISSPTRLVNVHLGIGFQF